MAANDQFKKRKQIPGKGGDKDKPFTKKHKVSSNPTFKKSFESTFNKSFDSSKQKPEKNEPVSNRDRRIQSKELAAARKKKRKPHYNLEQELGHLWEKMRRRNITKEDRAKMVSEAVQKMMGKMNKIAVSNLSCRVLQTCLKYGSQEEKDIIFEELRPHLITLSCNRYAVFLVTKMLDNASKKQLEGFIAALHGHVAPLLRHVFGSVVVEHAYQLGNAFQKQSLLLELYSAELQLFKDLVTMKERRLADLIPKLGLNKGSVARHMASVLQPILEKGILDHSITHTAILEYLNVADKTSAADVIEQLSGPLLVRMIHTKDGSKLGVLTIKHGGAKARKKVIKGMKTHIAKIASEQFGYMVLVALFSVVDDTKFLTKVIIKELTPILKDLVFDKYGRRPLLQLLHPNSRNYIGAEDLAALDLSVPSLCTKGEETENPLGDDESSDKETEGDADASLGKDDNIQLGGGGKKDPTVRRLELLVNSGLAESLVDTCIENVNELLQSMLGKDVIYEVARGGLGNILQPTLSEKLNALHEAIASLGALPRTNDESTDEEKEEEHVLENFHSSRTIRKLILDSPEFAATFWKSALKGKCKIWAEGHSSKILTAYLETSDESVRKMAQSELKPLIASGVIKVPETKVPAKQG
ncbi:hypothetical protein ACHQM5_015286 [Ranunculus cassubicifolius]